MVNIYTGRNVLFDRLYPEGELNGCKAGSQEQKKQNFYNNVVQINNYLPDKKQSVKIIPRNKHQEEYTLKLSNPKKDIIFGIGPAGTGKTLIAVLERYSYV